MESIIKNKEIILLLKDLFVSLFAVCISWIGVRAWRQQLKWSRREKYYMGLLSNLTKFKLSLLDRESYYMEPGSEYNKPNMSDKYFQELTRVGYESFQAIRELTGPASVFLSNRAIAALDKLESELWEVGEYSVCTAEYISSALRLVEAAYSRVLAEAKNEL